jgi:hypothetical protein
MKRQKRQTNRPRVGLFTVSRGFARSLDILKNHVFYAHQLFINLLATTTCLYWSVRAALSGWLRHAIGNHHGLESNGCHADG